MTAQPRLQLRRLPALLAGTALLCAISGQAFAQSRYGGPAASHTQAPHPAMKSQQATGRYGQSLSHPSAHHPASNGHQPTGRYGPVRGAAASAPIFTQFQQWVDWEPQYTLVPGDQLEVVVGSAPELSRTLTVGPDGRILMPLSEPVMAAGRTFLDVQSSLSAELGKQLRDPRISVTPRAYAPEQIFVGGQVGQPGTYTISSRIGALEAIFMAGGTTPDAKTKEVAVLRRAPNGGMMLRSVNIGGGLKDIHQYNDTVQLRRGDIIFVPQTRLSEVGQFVQALRQTLPFDFNIGYQFTSDGGFGNTTVITP